MLEGSLQWLRYLSSGSNCQVQRQLQSPQFWSLFLSKEPFPYHCQRDERLSWCLLSSQSTSWPPGSLSTCGSSHPSLPPKLLQLMGSPSPASHSLLAYYLGYSFSWSPLFVFFYLGPPWSPLPIVSPPHPHNPWPGPVCCRYSVCYFLSLLQAL